MTGGQSPEHPAGNPDLINPKWNVISRTIFRSTARIFRRRRPPERPCATTQSFFFSPKKPTNFGLIWGVGPAFLIPTSTDGIATNQWGAGITGVALKQSGHWTVGAVANQNLVDYPATTRMAICSDHLPAAVGHLRDTKGKNVLTEHKDPPSIGWTQSGRCRSTPWPRSGCEDRPSPCAVLAGRALPVQGRRRAEPRAWGAVPEVTLPFAEITRLDRRPTRTERVSLTLYAAPCNQAHVYEGGSLGRSVPGN